jgi:polar amino acid transport system substrate-binding protein
MKKVFIIILLCVSNVKALVVGIDPSRQPFSYYDEKNNLIGFDIEFFKEVEKRVDQKIEFKTMAFAGLLNALITKKIDMLGTAITVTPDREKKVAFTNKIYTSKLSFLGKKGNKNLKKEFFGAKNDIKEAKIGVVVGTPQVEYLIKNNFKNILYFDSIDVLYLALQGDKIDYLIHNHITNVVFTKKDANLKISNIISNDYAAFAVAKENKKLLKVMNNVIKKMENEGIIEELTNKYLE